MAASVIYNRSIFEQNGVAVPTTWDELIEVCEPLKAAGITPIYGTFRDPWTIAQGWFDYTVGGMVNVRDFYKQMHEIGDEVGPDSEVSFQKTLLEPVESDAPARRSTSNPDASSRGYGDGNTAMAQGRGGHVLPGALGLRGDSKRPARTVDLGTFPLPMTDNPADLKVRVNIDLSLWVPEVANGQGRAHAPSCSTSCGRRSRTPTTPNSWASAPARTRRPVTDPRIVEMQQYYDEGRFYMGASQFIPNSIPARQLLPVDHRRRRCREHAAPARRRLGAPGFPRVITLPI